MSPGTLTVLLVVLVVLLLLLLLAFFFLLEWIWWMWAAQIKNENVPMIVDDNLIWIIFYVAFYLSMLLGWRCHNVSKNIKKHAKRTSSYLSWYADNVRLPQRRWFLYFYMYSVTDIFHLNFPLYLGCIRCNKWIASSLIKTKIVFLISSKQASTLTHTQKRNNNKKKQNLRWTRPQQPKIYENGHVFRR